MYNQRNDVERQHGDVDVLVYNFIKKHFGIDIEADPNWDGWWYA